MPCRRPTAHENYCPFYFQGNIIKRWSRVKNHEIYAEFTAPLPLNVVVPSSVHRSQKVMRGVFAVWQQSIYHLMTVRMIFYVQNGLQEAFYPRSLIHLIW